MRTSRFSGLVGRKVVAAPNAIGAPTVSAARLAASADWRMRVSSAVPARDQPIVPSARAHTPRMIGPPLRHRRCGRAGPNRTVLILSPVASSPQSCRSADHLHFGLQRLRYPDEVEFRRINGLPAYVFAEVEALKLAARRAGDDVVDLGFGNPDIPSPAVAVDKLAEAAHNPRNHRYSASRGIPKLRQAAADLYLRRFGVELDPDRQVVTTIGAKEGLSHLMWVLAEPGDTVLAPSPSYPIHLYAPHFAGAEVLTIRMDHFDGPPEDAGDAFYANLVDAFEAAGPKPRAIIISFPHNPTTACIDLSTMTRLVEFARQHGVVLVHDFAYSDTAFDGYRPPSVLEVPGAEDVAVELYTLTKSFSMAGWRVAFLVGNTEIVQALTKLKSYLDYGTFQPVQIAAIVAMNEASDYPRVVNEIYQHRRDALCDGLARIGWEVPKPRGTMFVWARIPDAYLEMGSLDFAKYLVSDAKVATSPGVAFGPGGEGYVRFALVENEQRIGQAVRTLRQALTKL